MKFYNLKENDEQVSFAGAVKQGLGRNQGLFFPEHIPSFENIEELLAPVSYTHLTLPTKRIV